MGSKETSKIIDAFAEVARQALVSDYGQAKGAIADATRVMKRIIARSSSLPEGSEEFEIKVSRGPVLEFRGRLLAEHSWTTRAPDPMNVSFEVYQTFGGALVAVSSMHPADREGFEKVEALVVEPIEDTQAMRFAVMDFFEWSQSARSMAHKQLQWNLRRDVA